VTRSNAPVPYLRDGFYTKAMFGSARLPPRKQTRLEEFLDRFQIGIAPGDFAERSVHFKAFLQMLLRIPHVSEQRFVATHIVMIDWFVAQRGWAFEQKPFGFSGFAELM